MVSRFSLSRLSQSRERLWTSLTEKHVRRFFFLVAAELTIPFRISIGNVETDRKPVTARNRRVTRASGTEPLKQKCPNGGKTT